MSRVRKDYRRTEYNTWANMKQRVLNSKYTQYADYGGRGICIDEPWLEFKNFFADMGEKPGPEFSLERIDTNGNYCKENCVWADRYTQNWNQRKRTDNVSGRVGVHWAENKGKWIAQINVDGKRKQLIATTDYELACFCREEAELTYYKESKGDK